MFNGIAYNSACSQDKSRSSRVAAGTLTHSRTFPLPQRGTPTLVATFAPFPRSEIILQTLAECATGRGYEVCGQVVPLDDARQFKVDGDPSIGLIPVPFATSRRLKETGGAELLVVMDTTPAPETDRALVDTWRAAIGGLRVEVVDLEGQEAAPAARVVETAAVIDGLRRELLLKGVKPASSDI